MRQRLFTVPGDRVRNRHTLPDRGTDVSCAATRDPPVRATNSHTKPPVCSGFFKPKLCQPEDRKADRATVWLMSKRAQPEFEALLADARQDPDVLAVFLFGSRSRDGFADERSDYDVGVVVSDREGALMAFDERWPYMHGSSVEVASSTLSQLRDHGEYGTPSEWARYQYADVSLQV